MYDLENVQHTKDCDRHINQYEPELEGGDEGPFDNDFECLSGEFFGAGGGSGDRCSIYSPISVKPISVELMSYSMVGLKAITDETTYNTKADYIKDGWGRMKLRKAAEKDLGQSLNALKHKAMS